MADLTIRLSDDLLPTDTRLDDIARELQEVIARGLRVGIYAQLGPPLGTAELAESPPDSQSLDT